MVLHANHASALGEDHVLQDGSEADGLVDLRLEGRGEVDALGVTPPLDVEHPRVPPAVLVVADQPPRGVCRERRLAFSAAVEGVASMQGVVRLALTLIRWGSMVVCASLNTRLRLQRL